MARGTLHLAPTSFNYEVFVSIPGDPSVQDIILQGMKEGGQTTVIAGGTAYTEFKAYQFDTIKSEMWAKCKTDKLLETTSVLIANVGTSAVTLPTDFDSEVSLVIYDGEDPYRGTAQAGASSTMTLASSFSDTQEAMWGRYLFTTSGTGSGQFRQISAYDDTTKIATVSEAWTTQPDATTTYLVATYAKELRRQDYYRGTVTAARPEIYGRMGTGMFVYPAGDDIYPIIITYRSNLTRLDDAGSLFVKHLRERRSLWVQGVKVKTMARYDDDRYTAEKMIWDQMLMDYAAENVVYDRMIPNR